MSKDDDVVLASSRVSYLESQLYYSWQSWHSFIHSFQFSPMKSPMFVLPGDSRGSPSRSALLSWSCFYYSLSKNAAVLLVVFPLNGEREYKKLMGESD